MRGKSVALLVLALGCGLVASLGITQVLKRGDPVAPQSDTAPVYVAKADIGTGTLLTPEAVRLEQWPKEKVPAGALSQADDLDGRHAKQAIFADEPIIDRKLLARGQMPTESMVPKGLRVVPIQVGIEAIHSGLVVPGSRCDVQVFIHSDPNLGVGETLCKTILQDIRVFAVNDVTSTESLDPKTPNTRSIPTGKTVSLLVTPAQAQIVTLASQLGSIRLILRSNQDSDQPKTVAVFAHELVNAAGGSDREKENPVEADKKRFEKWAAEIKKSIENAKAVPVKASAGEEPQRFTMRVRLGAEVNDVMLINNSSVQGMPSDEGAWTAMGMGASPRGKPSADPQPSKPAAAAPAAAAPAELPPASTTPPKAAAGIAPLPTKPLVLPPSGV